MFLRTANRQSIFYGKAKAEKRGDFFTRRKKAVHFYGTAKVKNLVDQAVKSCYIVVDQLVKEGHA